MNLICDNCDRVLETEWSFSIGDYLFYKCSVCGATVLRKDSNHSYKVIYNSFKDTP